MSQRTGQDRPNVTTRRLAEAVTAAVAWLTGTGGGFGTEGHVLAGAEQLAVEDTGEPPLPVVRAPAPLSGEELVAVAVDQREEGSRRLIAVAAGPQGIGADDQVDQGLLGEVAAPGILKQQLPDGGVSGGRVPHHLLDRGGARGHLGGVPDDQGEPLSRILMPGGLPHPVTVEQGGGVGVAGDGDVEDPGQDRLLGAERLVDGRGRDRGLARDRLDGGSHVPALAEQPRRGVHHALPSLSGAFLPPPPGVGLALDWLRHTCKSITL